MLVLNDYMISDCWIYLGQVLEYAGSLAISRQPDPLQRRAIRKSESLNALFKAILRLFSFIGTIRLASERLGLLFILPAIAFLVTAAGVTLLLAELSREVQRARAVRDDAL